MRQLTELDVYILKQEFPHISLTEDPDIERYFEFRSLNRQTEALRLYNTKLIHRYPDDRMRVLLMTYYRKHDYRFHILLTDSLAQLAGRTIVQVKRVIVFFAGTIAPLKNAEVYTIIQVCEKVINAISPDRFAAIAFTEKYARYAERLKYHVADMRQAAEIIRMYITDTISSVREFREERNRQNAQTKTLQAIQKAQASVIDFSKIVFTKAQVDAITIPASILRVEDKVLAYTMKYWDRYADGAFENIVLLYSRKYGTNHYAVFHAVKIGRTRNWKDEELLHAVLANVAQGYYYSISGDVYLQRAWKQIKFKMESATQQVKALPAPAAKKAKPIKRRQQQSGKTAVVSSKPESGIPLVKPVSSQPTASKPAAVKPAFVQPAPEKTSPSVQIYPINSPKGIPVSIAETVKKVTGKSYGVYRDLFFKEVRSAIRTILQHSAVQKLSFFGSEQNDAENIIYEFLETNYDNPYQQWQGSAEQTEVFEQGFRIDSLEPIIRLWAKENL